MVYPPGKLPNTVLEKLLAQAESWKHDPRVLIGPRVGEDAAVLDFGANCLVLTTDPITFATDNIGWYAVQVNANDIATRGAQPRWFLAVALLPETHTDEALVTTIFQQINSACKEIGCTPIGGHTEITFGLERPIIVGQMIGEVPREKLVATGGAQVGDVLLLTKGLAIEGTAVLARERADELKARGVAEEVIARAQKLLFAPGISIVREALIANRVAQVHAMHDPTEGGLATGIAELAQASGVGVSVERAAIPILSESKTICAALDLDPLGTLASGALLLAVASVDAAPVVQALTQEGIACAQIGRVVPPEQGLKLDETDLPTFARDEVARALEI